MFVPGILESDETSEYNSLKNSYESGSYSAAQANAFLKKYPSSLHLDNVRYFAADSEPELDEYSAKLELFIKLYRKSEYTEKAYFDLCAAYYLSNRVDRLTDTAAAYMKFFPHGKYYSEVSSMLCRAYLLSQEYIKCRKLNETDSRSSSIIRNYTSYRMNNDKSFIRHSGTTAPDLYLAGNILEKNQKANEAFSAYTDTIRLFPKSPEAFSSAKRIKHLMPLKPIYVVGYLLSADDRLDFAPSRPVNEIRSDEFYRIEISPVYNLAEAKKIKSGIRKDYGSSVIVKRPREFALYIGKFANAEEALDVKIRLAEELGLNGHIVLVRKNGSSEYYSGE